MKTLKYFILNLQKKRKEAAASMNNLKLVPAMGVASSGGGGGGGSGYSSSGSGVNGAPPLAAAGGGTAAGGTASVVQLRKTASESNLLKMKMKPKRVGMAKEAVGPYQRGGGGTSNNQPLHSREPSIPETQAVSIVNVNSATNSDSLQGSPCSNHSTSSFGSNAAAAAQPPLTNASIGTYSSVKLIIVILLL